MRPELCSCTFCHCVYRCVYFKLDKVDRLSLSLLLTNQYYCVQTEERWLKVRPSRHRTGMFASVSRQMLTLWVRMKSNTMTPVTDVSCATGTRGAGATARQKGRSSVVYGFLLWEGMETARWGGLDSSTLEVSSLVRMACRVLYSTTYSCDVSRNWQAVSQLLEPYHNMLFIGDSKPSLICFYKINSIYFSIFFCEVDSSSSLSA